MTVRGTGENEEGVIEVGVPTATGLNTLGRLAFVNGTSVMSLIN